jgi:beta-lactamase class A
MRTDRVAPQPPLVVLVLLALVSASGQAEVGTRFGAPASVHQIDQKRIERLIAESGAETVAVAFCDLATGEQFLIKPDENFHAASTMKVPVMIEVFRQIGARKLSLDDCIPVKNEFRSIVDGSRYSLSPDSDSEGTLYKRIGQAETVRELLRLMIDASSNLATNLLIERVTAERVMETMREIGARNIRVLRGVEDSKAFQKGLNNTTTARDLMVILRHIAERRAVSTRASEEMIEVMLDQRFNEGIPAGLPKDVRVAHKTGSITGINHDAAIVYPPGRKPYVLVVLTRGLADESKAQTLIMEISREVYRSLQHKK